MFLLLGVFFLYKLKKDKNDLHAYLTNLNLKMVGVLVTDVDCPNGYNGFCILDIKVLQSNIKNYDERSKNTYYYLGVIKDSVAQIYQYVHDCKKGDTVVIDTKNNIILCNGLRYDSILVNPDPRFYLYVEKYHSKL